jgi:hypothetical protein
VNEFVLLVRNDIDHRSPWSPEQHQQFLTKCEDYIENLTKKGELKSIRPFTRKGKIIYGSQGPRKEGTFNEAKEVIVGYYQIFAEALNDAIMLAKGNPEFEYAATARIEVRPIVMREESTGFVYYESAN